MKNLERERERKKERRWRERERERERVLDILIHTMSVYLCVNQRYFSANNVFVAT